ncbi:MAG: hypothetical protein M1825_005657 [Sarcosagium campestre]|nr:MAG: hypothetical protein M1825_005657 [Sarcosagium campestre]
MLQLIDFSEFLTGNALKKQSAAKTLLAGFRNAGFVYLENFGIEASRINEVFAISAQFFKRSQEQKDSLAWTTPESNRGYVSAGREKVTNLEDKKAVEQLRAQAPDLKETFEIGRDDEPAYPNSWPDKFDQDGKVFKETMIGFFETCKHLQLLVMRAVALGMGLDETYFDEYSDGGDNTLRLLHYPSVRKGVFEENESQVRAGEHSDYGSITLLFQDDRGGLQVQTPRGNFVHAKPIPNTVVINAGDLLARWSNDTIRSTIHRVVEPPRPVKHAAEGEVDVDEYPARYSIAYFCNPNFDKFIDAIPGTYEQTGKKYEGVNSGEYLVQRLATTY